MDWWERFGAMHEFMADTPALAHDMAVHGPDGDFAYALAYAMQNTAAPIDVYPVDTQTLAG